MEEHSLNSFKGSLFYLKIIACIIMQMNHLLIFIYPQEIFAEKSQGVE